MINNIEKELEDNKNLEKSLILQKFFKTGKGEYAEGDIFLGLTIPFLRNLVKKYKTLSLNEIQILLNSKIHDKRIIALFFLIEEYKKSQNKKEIVDFYLLNTKNINNWDLVDVSCYKILSDYILKYNNMNYDILKKLAKSNNLWERRIAIVSTMIFIKNNKLEPTIEISKKLLKNEHDLINKAVGWLLRELGKKDINLLKKFLIDNIKDISSTTFNYATEKLSKEEKNKIKLLRKKS